MPTPEKSPVQPKKFSLTKKQLYLFGGIGLIVVLVLAVGIVLLLSNNKTTQNNSIPAFDLNTCIKDHAKPGEDPHIANDTCQALQDQYNKTKANLNEASNTHTTFTTTPSVAQVQSAGLGNANSTDPLQKGLALSNGQCEGTGSTKLTHAPMDIKDVGTIQPMGLMVGGHVTPIDHEYYYQINPKAPKDTYPVYADGDGFITMVEDDSDSSKPAWRVYISHSCTFISIYNLLTSITSDIKAKLPSNWGKNSLGGVKIPIKSGEVIGHVGAQTLDYQLADTTTQLKGFLYPVAYNNTEPWKVNTVRPLDYFNDSVKSQVLTKYMRTVEPRDGKIDYDVDGEAVGTWFLVGTNGYAGSDSNVDGSSAYYAGHLSLAYDNLDPSALTVSIGDYKGLPTQFAVKGNLDWTKITKNSGITKVELAQRNLVKSDGSTWSGEFATGIKLKAGDTQATGLLQMTEDQMMKVEVFAGKTPSQVTGFTSAAKMYDRGQNAHMILSNTAH